MSEGTPTIVAELLTTKEAAALVNCGERTLWRWSRSGVAPRPVKIAGSAVRYRRDEYLAWIAKDCPRVDGGDGRP
jgi:excisionase family DNA binding protein